MTDGKILIQPDREFRGLLFHRVFLAFLGLVGIFSLLVSSFSGFSFAGFLSLCLFPTFIFLQVHLLQEIGISSDRFWYKGLFKWHSIPLSAIESVEESKVWGMGMGLLVYSEELPFFYWIIKRLGYGRKKGRAIFVTRSLSDFDELKSLLGKIEN